MSQSEIAAWHALARATSTYSAALLMRTQRVPLCIAVLVLGGRLT